MNAVICIYKLRMSSNPDSREMQRMRKREVWMPRQRRNHQSSFQTDSDLVLLILCHRRATFGSSICIVNIHIEHSNCQWYACLIRWATFRIWWVELNFDFCILGMGEKRARERFSCQSWILIRSQSLNMWFIRGIFYKERNGFVLCIIKRKKKRSKQEFRACIYRQWH